MDKKTLGSKSPRSLAAAKKNTLYTLKSAWKITLDGPFMYSFNPLNPTDWPQ
jgi:hypothetical protein